MHRSEKCTRKGAFSYGSDYYRNPAFDYSNYGLIDKSELVTDPVYADVRFMDDFLVLKRGYRSSDAVNEWGYYDSIEVITVASSDDHWVRELPSNEDFCNCSFGLLMTLSSDQSLDLWNKDGEKVMHFDGTLFNERCDEKFTWVWTYEKYTKEVVVDEFYSDSLSDSPLAKIEKSMDGEWKQVKGLAEIIIVYKEYKWKINAYKMTKGDSKR